MAQLYEVLDQVSNPKSPSYGKYLSFEELGQLTVDEEAKALVLNHLTKFVEQSQVKVSKFTNFIQVNTDVKTAEKLLNGKYHTFHSKTTKKQVTRMLEFSLPEDLAQVLDYVSPTVHFPSRIGELETEQISDLTVRQDLENMLTPDIVKKFYNIPKDQVTNSKATQSMQGIDWVQGYMPEDLAAFQKYFKLSKDEATVVGKNDQELCLATNGTKCRASTGAIEWMMAIAQKAPTTFWNSAKEDGDFYLDWIESVAATENPPLVHGLNWGIAEDNEHAGTMERFSEEVAKLGTRGVTVVSNAGYPWECHFRWWFPSTVPYVLSVGTTMGPETGSPEIARQSDQPWSLYSTGGGFSNHFPRATYQKDEVKKYLSNDKVTSKSVFPPSSKFNKSGRAYPDVAIASNRNLALSNGIWQASTQNTPTFVGILTLANNARLNAGKSSLGFVNPALYQLYEDDPSIFNDITKGKSNCRPRTSYDSEPACCEYGFVAGKGWDAVTGVGSPKVDKLIEALKKL